MVTRDPVPRTLGLQLQRGLDANWSCDEAPCQRGSKTRHPRERAAQCRTLALAETGEARAAEVEGLSRAKPSASTSMEPPLPPL